ncbi:glycosyltransferase 87 family protein [Streptomyces kunmingensis]|uniref:Glycosyltransferase 87 family protein n=1 Tax=Streptomyces kunmingensis TaxID=68225 RepID=A0ABU6CKS4_9ACTN|nr:glycosyltransferase 87 family protein [Streptomyces kunmingensis]MEB3965232.1 glycosyltransferase 87 family protein [Streptomyces kunmingensis]
MLTRAAMLLLLVRDETHPLGSGGVAREVHGLYARWGTTLADGTFPTDDPLWQYPPGAGPLLLVPGLLPGLTYFQAFVTLTLATDALITYVLARGDRDPRGAWLWTAGLPLMLHIPLARYDIEVTAFAVLALLTLHRSPRLAGTFAALGALVKVWPALTLLGVERGRTTRQAWGAALAAAAAMLLVLALAFRSPFSFLSGQSGRGVQIESLGGTALALARRAGWPGRVRYQYGAMEYVGPYVGAVAAASLLLTGAAFAVLLWWRLRARRHSAATPYDAALCAVLMFTVTSRVISPQYLVWLLGLSAVCLTSRHTTQRTVALLVLAAAGVSALAYPVLYADVKAGTWLGIAVMAVRNGLLLAGVWVSFRSLWTATKA